MKIEIWADFVCPFCYIGKRRLEAALENFPHRDDVFIEYKSYQLDPTAHHIPDKDFYETYSERKGISLEQTIEMNQEIYEQALAAGLDFQLEKMKYTNTFDAHRIAQYARRKNKDAEIAERFLHAYFSEAKLLSDHDTLISLAAEVGLDAREVKQVLQSKKYTNQVNDDIDVAEQLAVETVPFFVFNEKYAVPGTQTAELFQAALEKVWEEEQKEPVFQTTGKSKAKTTYCTGESCEDG